MAAEDGLLVPASATPIVTHRVEVKLSSRRMTPLAFIYANDIPLPRAFCGAKPSPLL